MKILPKHIVKLAVFTVIFFSAFLLFGTKTVHAAALTVTSNTTWATLNPAAADTIVVCNNATLTVDSSTTAGVATSITLGGSSSPCNGSNAGTGALVFSASSAKVTISGAVSVGGGNRNGTVDMTSGGTLVAGSITTLNTPSFTSGSGTVQITGTTTLPSAAAFNTFNNLTINSAGTVTMGQALTITGNLVITAGTFSTSASNFNISSLQGNFDNSGTFTVGTSTVTMNGTTAQAIQGSTTTTFSSLTLSNTSVPITASTNFNASGTLTVTGTLTPSAAVVVGGSGTLTGAGTVQVTRTAATADFSSQYTITNKTLTNLTVDYAGSSAQTLNSGSFVNLTISCSSCMSTGTQTGTVTGVFTVTGTFTPSGGTITFSNAASSISNSGTLAFSGITISATPTSQSQYSSSFSVGGTLTLSGAITVAPTSGTITFTGGSISNSSGTLTFNNVTFNGTTTTSDSFSVIGTLSVGGSGNFSPSGGSVTMSNANSTISNSGTLVFNSLSISTTPTAQSQYNASFSVAGTLTVGASATFAPSGGTITMTGTGWGITNNNSLTFSGLTIAGTPSSQPTASFSISGALTVNNSVTLAPTSGTITFTGGSISNSGTLTFANITITGTTTTSSSFTINATLNISGGSLVPSGGTITMATTGWGITNSGTLNFNNITISETPTSQPTSSFIISGVLTVNSSKTLAPTAGTITFGNGSSISNLGTLTFNNATIASSATVSITTGTFTVGGTFTANSGSTVNWNNTSDVTILGGVTYVNLGVGRSADSSVVNYTLGGDITVSGVLTVGHASSTAADTFSASNKTITLSGTDGTPLVITLTWGSFSAGTSTVNFTGNNGSGNTTIPATTFATLVLNNGSETFTLAGNITADALTITAGTLDTTTNNPNITVNSGTGGLTVNGTLSGSGTGTIQVNGQSPFTGSGFVALTSGTVEMRGNGLSNIGFGTSSGSNAWEFYNLTFSNANASTPASYRTTSVIDGQIIVDGTLQIGSESDTQTTTLDNETNDRELVLVSVIITSKGVLQASSSLSCTVLGNWNNNGTFTANSGTVTFNGGGSQLLTGDTTFYGLVINSGSVRTVTFTGGSTTSVAANGTLTLTGAASNLLTLQSSDSSDWNLHVSTTGTTVSVSYVSVSHSNASGFKQIDASNGTNTNGGNNTNWTFIVPGSTPQSEIQGGITIQGGTQIGN